MAQNVAQKLISSHLVGGEMTPGEEIALRIDQTYTQDATGTTVMLELEAMEVEQLATELSVQYVDHNLLQTDERNADDHLFLYSACRKFGLWYSKPGNGVGHPVHQQRFGIPGKSMVGADSHTCAAGAIGMLAMGVGGIEVALAMIGEPQYVTMTEVWGVKLVGRLPDWVSAKDVILEMLRRHGVKAGKNRIIEYHGPGLENLDAMDRHVIANMGAELGATTTVFPSDEMVRGFLTAEGRGDDWIEIVADEGATYDLEEEIDLSALEPLIATPSSPGNVVPVAEVGGRDIYQAVVGSSANPGLRDFGIVAMIVDNKQAHPRVSFDINPTSRQTLENLVAMGLLAPLVRAGARIHQAGCLGCIGMGQAPATGQISVRTMPRNFPGRSGNKDDLVYLCSPETAAASALMGKITDPRELEQLFDMTYPEFVAPAKPIVNTDMLVAPSGQREKVELIKGPNIKSLPEFDPLPDELEVPVVLKMGDDISTDEIMPAGERVLPYRSNIPKLSEFAFTQIDPDYPENARKYMDSGHAVIGGHNYGQGSSREHAAVVPRYLGLRLVIAKSFARIHWQNLANFGILALEFDKEADWEGIDEGDLLALSDLHSSLRAKTRRLQVHNKTKDFSFELVNRLSPRQIESVMAGGIIPAYRAGKSSR